VTRATVSFLVGLGHGAAISTARAAQVRLRPAALNRTVRPQDDLFAHVNGHWLAETEIPADRVYYGAFQELAAKVERDLHAIIEDARIEAGSAHDSRRLSRGQEAHLLSCCRTANRTHEDSVTERRTASSTPDLLLGLGTRRQRDNQRLVA
jgi:predicted metalloendopeptidase